MLNDGLTLLLQIDAHIGGVNDLAFSHPNKQLCVITCGDDKTIKVCFFFILLVHKQLFIIIVNYPNQEFKIPECFI